MSTAKKIEKRLKGLGDAKTAEHSQRFFKTGPGEYGEGDRFLGIRVPVLRKLAKELIDTQLDDIVELLQSPFHEARLTALLVMTYQAKRGDDTLPLYRAYLANTAQINNWDLVDVTAEHILGKHLFERSRPLKRSENIISEGNSAEGTVQPLYTLAKSKSLWERRVAILSTFYFIRKNDFNDTLALADILLNDPEDLMHKAVGWMLREVGKRDLSAEEAFLRPRYRQMPRTMLRYAIERFPEPLRLAYLHGTR